MRSIRTKGLMAAALLTTATGCGNDPTGPAQPITELPRALTVAEAEIVQAGNAFAFDLLSRVHTAAPDSTVFLSPLSASMALGMTMNGATGEAQAQMREMLGFGDLALSDINASYRDLLALLGGLDPLVEISVANAFFHASDFPVEPAFLTTIQEYFDAPATGLDFGDPSAPETINRWVRQRTRDRIDGIVESPIPPDVVLYLLNAVYFNASWKTSFDPNDSYDGPFHGATGTGTVRFMTKEDSIGAFASERWEAVELPYGGGAWTMVVALPREGYALSDALEAMDELLDPSAPWGAGNRTLHLPRFEIEWKRSLNDDLQALGMVDAFRPGALIGLSPDPRLFISDVRQKTFVRVDEIGTEAAAITAVEGSIECACGPPEFRADRPFFLAIRERLSGTVLFAGLIVQPPTG